MRISLCANLLRLCLWGVSFLLAAVPLKAQGGPPLLTNDPGTPGNANWEINIGVMPVLRHDANQYQAPQLDINFGLGNRIQLTYEAPYVLQTSPGQRYQTGWSNSLLGTKVRFYEDNKWGIQISTFPQFEFAGPVGSSKNGIAEPSNRFFLPVEITKSFHKFDLNFEVGYFFNWSSKAHPERIIGFAAGRQFTPKLELVGEVYSDHAMGMTALPHDTTWDFGARYRLRGGFVLLLMAGRSFSSNTSGQPNFLGYVGIQLLLKDYGKHFQDEEEGK